MESALEKAKEDRGAYTLTLHSDATLLLYATLLYYTFYLDSPSLTLLFNFAANYCV